MPRPTPPHRRIHHPSLQGRVGVRLPSLPDSRQPSPRVSTDQTDGKSPLTFLPLLDLSQFSVLSSLMSPILWALWGSPLQGLRAAFDAAGAGAKNCAPTAYALFLLLSSHFSVLISQFFFLPSQFSLPFRGGPGAGAKKQPAGVLRAVVVFWGCVNLRRQ
jgi:hypothetical protein